MKTTFNQIIINIQNEIEKCKNDNYYGTAEHETNSNDIFKTVQTEFFTTGEWIDFENYAISGTDIENYTYLLNRLVDMAMIHYTEWCKNQIMHDININKIPITVKSFSELHDYVDANCYGGFCDDGYIQSTDCDIENKVQNAVDTWIKSGQMSIDALNRMAALKSIKHKSTKPNHEKN